MLEPNDWVDDEMATQLAEVVVELLTNGAFDDLPESDYFAELSQSRMGYGADVGLADMLEGDAFVESHLHVGGRFEWYSGFDQIELHSPRASLGQIRTERRNGGPLAEEIVGRRARLLL